jgi:hypothetical protein
MNHVHIPNESIFDNVLCASRKLVQIPIQNLHNMNDPYTVNIEMVLG